jgi:hypothetical protein
LHVSGVAIDGAAVGVFDQSGKQSHELLLLVRGELAPVELQGALAHPFSVEVRQNGGGYLG